MIEKLRFFCEGLILLFYFFFNHCNFPVCASVDFFLPSCELFFIQLVERIRHI